MPSAIVPLKLNSERVPGKNFRLLGDKPLWHFILATLAKSQIIDNIYVYSSDQAVLENMPGNVRWLPRHKSLDSPEVTATELFLPAVEAVQDEIQLITHVTSPFIRPESIDQGLNAILSGEHDSAFSVEKCRKYAWLEGRRVPLNYDPVSIPRTQDIQAVMIESSGFYAFTRESYIDRKSRIGSNPKPIPISFPETIDIDTELEFNLAELIVAAGPTKEF